MEVILYTTGCPKCSVLKKKLEEKGIEFKVCDSVEEMTAKGFTHVPMLSVDGGIMEFTAAAAWVNKQ